MGSIDAFLRFTGLAANTNSKGNKGKGASKRRMHFLGVLLVGLVGLLGVVHILLPESKLNTKVMRHAKQLRQRAGDVATAAKNRQHGTNRKRSSDFDRSEIKDLILQGKLNLVEIRTKYNELADADEDSYDGVYGVFCRLNFAVHKEDPSSYPMFRDVLGKSPLCDENYHGDDILGDDEEDLPRGRFQYNLKHLAEQAREADDEGNGAKNLALTGVAFHESRCGSTLVANSLIAMNPTKNRVYSESAPPMSVLGLCEKGEGSCKPHQAAMILRDVMFFMGRTDDPEEERFFFKIQSAGTKSLATFRAAFPKTPWLFVYRDPVQVMMSHFALGIKSANCLRQLHSPSHLLQKLAKRRGYRTVGGKRHHDDDEGEDASKLKELSPQEFCAAHLATLTETAAHHIQESDGLGRAVNYINLPTILYEEVLPAWGVSVSDEEITNIQEISGHYSKGRGKQKKDWKEDSEKKEEQATPEIQDASKIFLKESFDLLESLASSA